MISSRHPVYCIILSDWFHAVPNTDKVDYLPYLISFFFSFFLFIITVFFQDDDLDPLIPIVLCSKVQTACDEFMSGINGWLVAAWDVS